MMAQTLYRSPPIIRKKVKASARGFSDLGIKNVKFNETSKLPIVTDRRGSNFMEITAKKAELVKNMKYRRNTMTMENSYQVKNFGNATYSEMIAKNIIKH